MTINNLKAQASPSELIGWLSCILLPAAVFYGVQHSQLPWAPANFMVIFSAALMMWVFRLVPEYVPAVFVILATVLLGIAPQATLLSGFASESFFLALSVFGLGAVVVSSRIFYRISLLLLQHLPRNVFLLQVLVFFIGGLLTPIMTAQSSRVSLMVPFLEDLRSSAHLKSKGVLANSLVCCAFQGATLLSAIFLTGKSSNLVLFGMLSKQMQWQFSWFNWFVAASFPALLMIICFFILLKWTFKKPEPLNFDNSKISQELMALGRMTLQEWVVLICALLLLIGLITSSWHHISSAWMCFTIFFFLIISGVLSKKEFKQGVNWPFLFYLGAIIGIMRCVQATGIDSWLVDSFDWVEKLAEMSNVLLVIVIYLLGWLGSFIFGTAAAPALLFTMLLPVAEHAAISTWLIAFVLLMSTEAWLFPYQSSYYLCFEEQIEALNQYKLPPTLKMNAYFIVLRFLVIMASIPVWQWMQIL